MPIQLKWSLILVALLVCLAVAADWVADLLWFETLGYTSVFWRIRLLKVGLFLSVFLIVLAYVWANLYILARELDLGSFVRYVAVSPQSLPTAASGATARLGGGLGVVVASVVIALGYAWVFGAGWDTYLRFYWARPFGEADPIFGHDIGFYVFTLPLLDWIQNGVLVLALGMSALLVWAYQATGLLNITGAHGRVTRPSVRLQVAANVALFLLALAVGFFFDRFELLQSTRGAVYGAGYTDVHFVRPVLWIMVIATLVLAVALFLPWRARWGQVGLGTYVALLVVGLWIVPFGVQSFRVEPNELELETPFLRHNIAFTRQAFGLANIDERSYKAPATLSPQALERNRETIDNIRLWDWRPLIRTFRQLQQIRTYYVFNDVDVDRYQLDGAYRQVMVAARELTDNLPSKLETWVNRYLQYTHGYGLAMSLAAAKEAQGSPVLIVRDLPPRGSQGLSVVRPAIYYGEKMSGHRIVASSIKEFDYPHGDENVYTRYHGSGGIRLDAFWKRLLFAWQQFDFNIVLTEYVTEASRLQLWRRIGERVERLAPFLKLDADPYLVVGQNGLYWIQDAYTVSSEVPYSETHAEGFNYIRNSVKVVVDAYDGDVSFYVIDAVDPILRVYREAMPKLFQRIEAMPADLRQHLRYPVDLFKAQVEQYSTYHMTVPQVFYNGEDLWTMPREKYGGERINMVPYYVLMTLPDEARLQFLLMLPLTPARRDNMIAWVAARCDYPGYGELIAYKLPKERLLLGPLQVEAMIDQDTLISQQLSLWDQRGSRVVRGNILVIPIDQAFIYVEPVYLIAEGTDIPQLKRVIVSDGDRLAMEPTLDEALGVVFGLRDRRAPASPAAEPTPKARAALEAAERALRDGDWDAFGREMQRLKGLLGE